MPKVLMGYPLSNFGGVETWIREVGKILSNNFGYDVLLTAVPKFEDYHKKRLFYILKYQIRNENPDIIHLHLFSFGLIKYARRYKIPVVSTIHGSAWGRFFQGKDLRAVPMAFLEMLRYKYSNVSVAVSREVQRWYPNSIYIPNGVNPSLFLPQKQKYREDREHIYILWRGRKNFQKGLEFLQKLEKTKNFKLLLPKKIVRYKTLPKIYNQADVFVLTSRYEGMPLTALEAMACGLPVVAFRVGGLPDIVFDDFNGYLVPYGDIDALKDAIIRAYENRRRLGRNGRWLVEKIFNWEYVAKRYKELYESLLRW